MGTPPCENGFKILGYSGPCRALIGGCCTGWNKSSRSFRPNRGLWLVNNSSFFAWGYLRLLCSTTCLQIVVSGLLVYAGMDIVPHLSVFLYWDRFPSPEALP